MINKIIVKTLPLVPKSIVHLFAKKYIAGDTLDDAVRVTKELMKKNGMSTIDVLGEFVETKELALHEKEQASKVLDAIKNEKLDTYLSVKPTSLGMGIDFQFGYENILELVEKAKMYGIWVRLDMENSPYTQQTIDMYRKFRDNGYDNVGIVFQAYMKRTEDDIKSLIEYKPSIRLCKGIYVESPQIAFRDFTQVQNNYKKLLRLILDNDMYVGIATHDDDLINDALSQIKERNLDRNDYEFQMLLGVKDKLRDELLGKGHRLRVYVPYGKDWYGYSTRRLKENPKIAGHIVKSIFGMG